MLYKLQKLSNQLGLTVDNSLLNKKLGHREKSYFEIVVGREGVCMRVTVL